MTLFINACVRNTSRTEILARALLDKIGGADAEVRLEKADLPTLTEAKIMERANHAYAGNLDAPLLQYAVQFAAADEIVIAAPYWDLSFPALLKRYLELVSVVGVTFRYSENGVPQGLCRAKKLWYVSTSGGPYLYPEFGYGYVKALCTGMFGIPQAELIYAENLDVVGNNPDEIIMAKKVQL